MPTTHNPLYAWLGRLEREKLLQEKRRLLYVAATRAERSLHLLGSCEVDRGREDRRAARCAHRTQASALGLLWASRGIRRRVRPTARRDRGDIEGEAGPVIPRDPVLLRLPDGWHAAAVARGARRSSCASSCARPRPLTRRIRLGDGDGAPRRHGGAPRAAALRARGGGDACRLTARRRALQRRYAAELAELGVPHERRERRRRQGAGGRATHARRRTRALAAQCRRTATRQAELALTGVVDREARQRRHRPHVRRCDGRALDRRLQDQQRTKARGSTSSWTTSASAIARNSSAMRSWCGLLGDEPIRLGLYFPLLSAWREWDARRGRPDSERAADAELTPARGVRRSEQLQRSLHRSAAPGRAARACPRGRSCAAATQRELRVDRERAVLVGDLRRQVGRIDAAPTAMPAAARRGNTA